MSDSPTSAKRLASRPHPARGSDVARAGQRCRRQLLRHNRWKACNSHVRLTYKTIVIPTVRSPRCTQSDCRALPQTAAETGRTDADPPPAAPARRPSRTRGLPDCGRREARPPPRRPPRDAWTQPPDKRASASTREKTAHPSQEYAARRRGRSSSLRSATGGNKRDSRAARRWLGSDMRERPAPATDGARPGRRALGRREEVRGVRRSAAAARPSSQSRRRPDKTCCRGARK